MKKISFFLPLVICILCASMVHSYSPYTKVEVVNFEIVRGKTETRSGEDAICVFEGCEYVVRATLQLPSISDRKMFLYTFLNGGILVEYGDTKLESKEKSCEISQFQGRRVDVELKGRSGYALVNRGSRMVTGEVEDYRFFRVTVDGLDAETVWQDRMEFVLTTEDIFNARKKIEEVRSALSELEKDPKNADLKAVQNKTDHIRELLDAADECINEGAPRQALQIAETCMDSLFTSVLEDQINFFNDFVGGVSVDKMEASDHLHEARTKSMEAEEASTFNEYILSMSTARDELDEADASIRKEVCNAAEGEGKYKAYVIVELIVIICLAGLIIFLQTRKKETRRDVIKEFTKGEY